MTFTTLSHSDARSFQNSMAGGIYHMVQRFNDFRAYRKTVAELDKLTGAQLADLGLHRSEIKRAAHEAIYGV